MMLLSHQEALKIEKLLICDNGAASVHILSEGLVACSNLKRALMALHNGNDSEEGPAAPLDPECIESLDQATYLLTSVASSASSLLAKKSASHCLPPLAEALSGYKMACDSCVHHMACEALKGSEEVLDACSTILSNGGLSSNLLLQHLLPELGTLWKSCVGDAAMSLHVIGMTLAAVNFMSDQKSTEDNCISVASIHSLERILASTPPLVAAWGRQDLGNDAVAAWLHLVSACIPLTCGHVIKRALVNCAVECAVAFHFTCPFVGLGLGNDSSCDLITEGAVRLDATQTSILLALRWGGDVGRLFPVTDDDTTGGMEEQFVHCFSSEDDRLLEALWLALILHKSSMPLCKDSEFPNRLRPSVLLMELLKIIAYDESVLLDWIISPETSLLALQYFVEVSSYLVLQKQGPPLNKDTRYALSRLCDQIQKLQRSRVFPFNATSLVTRLLAIAAYTECE